MLRRWRQRRRLLLLLSHQNNDIIRLIITIISVDLLLLSFSSFSRAQIHSIIDAHATARFITHSTISTIKHGWNAVAGIVGFVIRIRYGSVVLLISTYRSFARHTSSVAFSCFANFYCLRSLAFLDIPRVQRQGYIHYFLINVERKGKTWLKPTEQVNEGKTSRTFLVYLLLLISPGNVNKRRRERADGFE